MRNPYAKAAEVLKVQPATYDAAKAAVVAYCQAHTDKPEIPDAELKPLHAALASAEVLNEVKKEVGG